MPFLTEAQRLVADPNTPPLLRATLDYMLQNCVGINNAQPIATVVEHLNAQGFAIDREQFQHQVLVPSREDDLYIASYGYFGHGGIYLVQCREDAQPMIDFYMGRIASEQRHLDQLIALRNAEWPQP
jgi:hypothetical protein